MALKDILKHLRRPAKEGAEKLSPYFITLQLGGENNLVRTETLKDGDYLVAPTVAIREGIVRGTPPTGAEFIPGEVITDRVDRWNFLPVVRNHPFNDSGMPTSARQPEVYDDHVIGRIYNACATDTALKLEVWINRGLASQTPDTEEIITKLENGEMVEVSIGGNIQLRELYDWDWIPQEYKRLIRDGEQVFIWAYVYPDHIALLTGDVEGACNNEMGCGTPRVNQSSDSQDEQRTAHQCNCPDGQDCNCNSQEEKETKMDEEEKKAKEKAEKEAALKANKDGGGGSVPNVDDGKDKTVTKANESTGIENIPGVTTQKAEGATPNTPEEPKLNKEEKKEEEEKEVQLSALQAAKVVKAAFAQLGIPIEAIEDVGKAYQASRTDKINKVKNTPGNQFTDDDFKAMSNGMLDKLSGMVKSVQDSSFGGLPNPGEANIKALQKDTTETRGYLAATNFDVSKSGTARAEEAAGKTVH